MRIFFTLLFLAALVVGCTSKGPYTEQDLRDVKRAYRELVPIYKDFQTAFERGDSRGIVREYRREQRACHRVDAVDQRDTIDPNVNLFQVSVGLDTICNQIESAYVAWAKAHGKPYDEDIVPAFQGEAFLGSEELLEKMPEQLRRPAELA